MAETASNGNGNGKRFQMTVSLGSVIQIVSMLGAVAVIYAQISSRIAVLEVKVDNLSSWVHVIASDRHPPPLAGVPQ
jgi:hypothetical protein